jgi:thioredoxin reductase
VTTRGFDIKAAAGKAPRPERAVEVLVVGGGLAGTAAAVAAAQGGAKVLLIDEHPLDPGLMGLDTPLFFGGRHGGAARGGGRLMEQVFAARPGLEAAFEAGVEIELGLSVWGVFAPGYGLASLPSPMAGLADRSRSWMVGFQQAVIAAGARDVAFAFPGWDQPGVMGAAALASLISTYDAFEGRRLVILGSGALAVAAAELALARGLDVAALVEVAAEPQAPPEALSRLAGAGVEILAGLVPLLAEGGLDGVVALTVRPLDGGADRRIACDTIVEAVSLTPAVELLDVAGADLTMAPELGGFVAASPDGVSTSVRGLYVAGDAAGTPGGAWMSAEAARRSGRRAGRAAVGETPVAHAGPGPGDDAVALQQAWVRALMALDAPQTVVCQCEAVTLGDLVGVRPPAYLGPPSPAMQGRDLRRLLDDGPANPDQIKRLTRAMMGPCQGRRCREQAALAIACASNTPPQRMPLAGYRAPVRPLPLQVLADWAEDPLVSQHWDVWFGIPTQWIPDAHVGTEREALYAGILGEAAPDA